MGELLGFYIVGIPRLNIYTYIELERPTMEAQEIPPAGMLQFLQPH